MAALRGGAGMDTGSRPRPTAAWNAVWSAPDRFSAAASRRTVSGRASGAPAFQCADPLGRQPRPLRQLLLREAGRHAVTLEQQAEGSVPALSHLRTLALSRCRRPVRRTVALRQGPLLASAGIIACALRPLQRQDRHAVLRSVWVGVRVVGGARRPRCAHWRTGRRRLSFHPIHQHVQEDIHAYHGPTSDT